MRKLGALAVIAALPYVARGEDDVADEAARLQERIEALEAALYPRGRDRKLVTKDMSRMRKLAGLAAFSKLTMRDGALDVYHVVASAPADKQLELLRSSRTGVGPSPSEIQKGDYTHFPYERFRGAAPPKKGEEVPILWDRVAHSDGTRLVALLTGVVKRMEEADVLALLDKCGQSTLRYSKDAVSFAFPRRFRLTEIRRGLVLVILVDDPVTRSLDIMIALHGKQTPQYFAEFIRGLKSGIKVETVVEQAQTKERIGDEEVAGTKIVYLRENDTSKHVMRFFTVQEAYSVVVQTTQARDAFVYQRLGSILRSVAFRKEGSD